MIRHLKPTQTKLPWPYRPGQLCVSSAPTRPWATLTAQCQPPVTRRTTDAVDRRAGRW